MFPNRHGKRITLLSSNFTTSRDTLKGQKKRLFRPQVEILEDRDMLSATPTVTPPIIVVKPSQSATPPAGAYTPAQIQQAYGINAVTLGNVVGDGSGQTIAIVDAYDNPALVSSNDPNFATSDLAQFDKEFGLPDPPSFLKLNQEGQEGNYPPVDPSGPGSPTSWEVEEALDVEWAHSIAPKANIILIEANDPTTLFTAVAEAATLPQVSVVSMSFGSAEFAGENQTDSTFTTPAGHQGITFLAATGDNSAPGGYPAYSPNVVAVGGTTLTINAAGDYIGETGWGDGTPGDEGSGGGISQFESQPSYQQGVVTRWSTTQRTNPDVAFDADPNTGVAIYDSYDFGTATPWIQVGGTSLACPCWAGIIAITNQDRALYGLGTLNGTTQTLPQLYKLPESDFHDIVSGSNGYPAGPGYDLVTGRGSPNAPLLIPDLADIPKGLVKDFHPFRYIVQATNSQSASVFTGNITVVSTISSSSQFYLVIGALPEGVTLNSSVQTTTLPSGQQAIPLPVSGLTAFVPVRVEVKFNNPKHVPISTFFEGFEISLATAQAIFP